jgi:hypothetical protein
VCAAGEHQPFVVLRHPLLRCTFLQLKLAVDDSNWLKIYATMRMRSDASKFHGHPWMQMNQGIGRLPDVDPGQSSASGTPSQICVAIDICLCCNMNNYDCQLTRAALPVLMQL